MSFKRTYSCASSLILFLIDCRPSMYPFLMHWYICLNFGNLEYSVIDDSLCIGSHVVCKTFALMFLRNLLTSDCCGMCLHIKSIGISGVIYGFALLYISISGGQYVVSSLLLFMFDISEILFIVEVMKIYVPCVVS